MLITCLLHATTLQIKHHIYTSFKIVKIRHAKYDCLAPLSFPMWPKPFLIVQCLFTSSEVPNDSTPVFLHTNLSFYTDPIGCWPSQNGSCENHLLGFTLIWHITGLGHHDTFDTKTYTCISIFDTGLETVIGLIIYDKIYSWHSECALGLGTVIWQNRFVYNFSFAFQNAFQKAQL